MGRASRLSFACLLGGPRLVAGDGVAVDGKGGAGGDDNVWTGGILEQEKVHVRVAIEAESAR